MKTENVVKKVLIFWMALLLLGIPSIETALGKTISADRNSNNQNIINEKVSSNNVDIIEDYNQPPNNLVLTTNNSNTNDTTTNIQSEIADVINISVPLKTLTAHNITKTKYGDQYDAIAGEWLHFGEHGIRLSQGIGDGLVNYSMNIGYNHIGTPLKIGVYFKDITWMFWLPGPDLRVYNWTRGNWDTFYYIGNQDDFQWSWEILYSSYHYIRNGTIKFNVFAAWSYDTWIDTVGIDYFPPPGNPSNLHAYNTTYTSIQLSWIPGTNCTHTIIKRREGSYPDTIFNGTFVYIGSSNQCNDTQLSPGKIYYYRAWAYDINGQIWSEGFTQDYNFTKPADPTNLDAYNPSAHSIQLKWVKGSGADKTKIQRQTGSYPATKDAGYTVYFGIGNSTLDTSLAIGTKYYYRAWSYNNTGDYSQSYSQDNETTINYPQVITNNVENIGKTYVQLSGTIINDGGQLCQIRFKIRSIGGEWSYTDDWQGAWGTGQTFTQWIDNLNTNTTYQYQAGAKNSAGERWGDIKSFTTQLGAPVIREVKTYYADGSNASNRQGFLLQGLDLQIWYTAFVFDNDADKVKFCFGTQEYIDTNRYDGWTAIFNSKDITDTQLTLKVCAYNNSRPEWGKNLTLHPKIIPMDSWLLNFMNYVKLWDISDYVSFSIHERDNPPLQYNNFWVFTARVDLSEGQPANPNESPMLAKVPNGVPSEFGGNYSYSGGLGCAFYLCSDKTIIVSGIFNASVTVKNLCSGGIHAVLVGHFSIDNTIIWHDMYINVGGWVGCGTEKSNSHSSTIIT
jgi:hypothetical protein